MLHRLLLILLVGGWVQPLYAGGKLAIVIDDIGYSALYGERTLKLPGKVTLAVLPLTPHGARLAKRGHAAGKEVILHIPMSNSLNLPLDAGGLDGSMDRQTFLTTLRENLASIPHIQGVNNHMGSQLTQEAQPMGWLMEELADQQLFFIDSRTSAASRGYEIAQRYGVPSAERHIFLDNERDVEAIARQLNKALDLARKRGQAIAIGHPYPETLAVLEAMPPLLLAYQVELVPVSSLLNTPPAFVDGTGRCLAPPSTLWYRPQSPPQPVNTEHLLQLNAHSKLSLLHK